MSVYSRLQATATRLLNEYGETKTFTRTTDSGSYNPSVGGYTQSTSTFDKLVVKDTYSVFERANSVVESGDIKLIAEQGDYEEGDTLDFDGDTYRVFMVDPIKPASTTCAVMLGVRK